MDDQDDTPTGTPPAEAPEFGPRGYLPERASKRARKIVLRAPMGIQWVIGSLVVGVVVAVAGFLLLRDEPPPPAFVEVGAVDPTGTGSNILTVGDAGSFVYVREGRPRVFALPDLPPPSYCRASGLIEAPDGRAWRVTGRGLDGTSSLREHPTIIDDGVLFLDPTTTLDPPAPSDEPADLACSPAA